MYGKQTLAHTGASAATLAGVTVLGMTVPWLAIGATAFVLTGAVALRLSHKLKTRDEQ